MAAVAVVAAGRQATRTVVDGGGDDRGVGTPGSGGGGGGGDGDGDGRATGDSCDDGHGLMDGMIGQHQQ